MAAHENVNKYQFHEHHYSEYQHTYLAYKGDRMVGSMSVWHDNYDSEPGAATVGSMRMAPGHRHVAGTLLGIGATKMAEKGLRLIPSDDLSPHSSKLVDRLKDKGLVTESRYSDPSNDIDFYGHAPRVAPEKRQGRRLNTGEVTEGRQAIRRALKGR